MARINVILADDHPIVLRGLRALLAEEKDIAVIAAGADGGAAWDLVLRHDPDIAILDLSMPVMTGTDVLARIRKARLRTRVVVLTASASDAQVLAVITAGANGIILKDMAADDLVRCVRAVASGGRWLPREIFDRALLAASPDAVAPDAASRTLTPREREVSLLVAAGLSNKEIGHKLDVTDGTVKVHLNNIFQKTGVTNRTALAALAITYRGSFVGQ